MGVRQHTTKLPRGNHGGLLSVVTGRMNLLRCPNRHTPTQPKSIVTLH